MEILDEIYIYVCSNNKVQDIICNDSGKFKSDLFEDVELEKNLIENIIHTDSTVAANQRNFDEIEEEKYPRTEDITISNNGLVVTQSFITHIKPPHNAN